MKQGKFAGSRSAGAWAFSALVVLAAAPAARAATYTWSAGGGANVNWSNPSNWGGSAPAGGETGVALVFPALAAHYASNNDLTGLQVVSLGITTQLSGGAYLFSGNSIHLDGPVTMASPGSGTPNLVWQIPLLLGGDVTISTSGRQTQIQGPIDLDGNTLTLDATGDVVLAGVISGSGNLVKDNSAALTITGANTYTGSTTGNGGALYVSSPTAFGATGTGTTFHGGFLGFSGNTFTTSEPFLFDGGGILAYGTHTMAGQVTLAKTTDIQVFEAAAILTVSGTIVGAGGLSKTGPGLLILNAVDDSYAGATGVHGGTLRLDSNLSNTNQVTVSSGATLKGNASIAGAIHVLGGGTVAPGSSPGALSSRGLSMSSDATFAAEIDGPTPTTQYDQIAVAGPVSLGSATLALALAYAPPDGQQFTLIAQSQGEPVSGTFAALDEGATFQVGATTFGITYRGGSGNDVVLVAGATPAPTSTPTEEVPDASPSSTPSDATATPTGSHTPALASATPTVTPTPTPSPLPSPTATELSGHCTGDCGDDHAVTVDEVVYGVHLALGDLSTAACPRFDTDPDDRVSLAEILRAVDNALAGCAP